MFEQFDITETLKTLLKHGVEVSLFLADDGSIGYELFGFYKSGSVRLVQESDNSWVAHARYNETTDIHSLKSLIILNESWYIRSANRYDGWKEMNPAWKSLEDEFMN